MHFACYPHFRLLCDNASDLLGAGYPFGELRAGPLSGCRRYESCLPIRLDANILYGLQVTIHAMCVDVSVGVRSACCCDAEGMRCEIAEDIAGLPIVAE